MTPFAVERHAHAPPDAATVTVRHEPTSSGWLDERTHEWVAAGLITDEQAAAVAAYERAAHAPAPASPDALRFGPVAEAGAYVGAVLALIGGTVALGPRWTDAPMVGRLGVAAALALVGFVAGTWLVGVADAGARRLGSFLWVLGTGGIALAAGTVAAELDLEQDGWIGLWIGLPVMVLGIGLWDNADRPLQLLTAAVGVGMTFGATGALIGIAPWVGGIVLWFGGAAWWALTVARTIRPTAIARCVGGVALLAGSFMLGDLSPHLSGPIALATAAAIVLLALRERIIPAVVVGVVGAVLAAQMLLQNTMRGPAAAAAVAVAGMMTVVIVVARARQSSRR